MADPVTDIFIGDMLSYSYTAKDQNGDPSDLTGWTAIGSLKASDRSEETVLDLDPTIPTPTNGVTLVNKNTNDIAAGQYVMDVRRVNDADTDRYITLDRRIVKFRRPVTTYVAP